MATAVISKRVTLKNILYLTDFSEPSEAALPFAIAVAREYGAKVFALHVFMPQPYMPPIPELTLPATEAQEEAAKAEMQRVESQLAGLPHETIVERGVAVWATLEQAVKNYQIDLLVLGTHGRTGAQKLLLGSVAEEIFRRSSVPVLTIGPQVRNGVHSGGRFHGVLFATDFTRESLAAAPYAISLAEENDARLFVLHVMPHPGGKMHPEGTAADAMHKLHELLPKDAEMWCRPEALVRYGNPAEQILKAAAERGGDLVVLGVRDAAGYLGAATHLERTTAHNVVAHAPCAVLTVRG